MNTEKIFKARQKNRHRHKKDFRHTPGQNSKK